MSRVPRQSKARVRRQGSPATAVSHTHLDLAMLARWGASADKAHAALGHAVRQLALDHLCCARGGGRGGVVSWWWWVHGSGGGLSEHRQVWSGVVGATLKNEPSRCGGGTLAAGQSPLLSAMQAQHCIPQPPTPAATPPPQATHIAAQEVKGLTPALGHAPGQARVDGGDVLVEVVAIEAEPRLEAQAVACAQAGQAHLRGEEEGGHGEVRHWCGQLSIWGARV